MKGLINSRLEKILKKSHMMLLAHYCTIVLSYRKGNQWKDELRKLRNWTKNWASHSFCNWGKRRKEKNLPDIGLHIGVLYPRRHRHHLLLNVVFQLTPWFNCFLFYFFCELSKVDYSFIQQILLFQYYFLRPNVLYLNSRVVQLRVEGGAKWVD